jgi:hypothetical protein
MTYKTKIMNSKIHLKSTDKAIFFEKVVDRNTIQLLLYKKNVNLHLGKL